MRLHDLEQSLSENLGTPVIVVSTNEGIDPAGLNQIERDCLRGFRFARRRRDWLLGRNALKEVLLALGRNEDTTEAVFPGSRVSLTHAGDTAFAAATSQRDRSIGIDYEPLRDLDNRVARWFLNDEESAWFGSQRASVRSKALVRLWTVKEAAFKSHPDNGRMSFSDFPIDDPSSDESIVVAGGHRINIASRACRSGYLSIAICGERQ